MAALNLKLVCAVAVLCMLVVDPMATAALSCGKVRPQLIPCLGYLHSSGNKVAPPGGCCNAVRGLNGEVQGKADRQMACNCIKGLLSIFRGLNQRLVEDLPKNCNVKIPFKISTSTDCSKVN